VWALRTLEELREKSADGPVELRVSFDGEAMPRATRITDAGRVTISPDDPRVYTFRVEALAAGDHRLTVSSQGEDTSAVAQLTTRYAVPWSSPRAALEGEHLLARMEPGARAVERGQTLEIEVEVTNATETEQGAWILELPRPPASWVERTQFDDLVRAGRIDRYEVLPTHVRLYLSGLEGRGEIDLSYRVTPTRRGRYRLPPLRSYVYYNPAPRTERPGGELVVK
jgi:uncharacterized protein YfaS (alpha-2-macroglobulin family)